MKARSLVLIAVAAAGTTTIGAQAAPRTRAADSSAVVATLERFHSALASGDSASTVRLLAPDLTVMEGGGVERLADYLARHLGADIAYAKAVPSQRTVNAVSVDGDVAWVVGTSVTKGTYRDRPVNSSGAELVVLSRTGSGWMIRSIHWSSRRVNP